MERERRLWAVTGGWPSEKAGRYWRHLGGWPGLLLRVGFLSLTMLAIGMHLPDVASPIGVGLVLLSVLLAASAAMPLAVYATIWAVFIVARAVADDPGLLDRGGAVAAVDRWLGGGALPSARLQGWLHESAVGGVVDGVASVVHLSYFAVPHLVAVGFWWLAFTGRTERHFRSYVAGLARVMIAGTIIFTLFPTAPPWMEASRSGESPRIERISGGESSGASSSEVYVVADPNANPSQPPM